MDVDIASLILLPTPEAMAALLVSNAAHINLHQIQYFMDDLLPRVKLIQSEMTELKDQQKTFDKDYLKQRPGDTRFDTDISVDITVSESPKLLFLEDFDSM